VHLLAGATPPAVEMDAAARRHGYSKSMLDEVELARLLGAMGRGDRDAAQALYRLIGGRIYGIARRILRDASLAEDAAHQAFLKIWKNAHRFDAAKGKASTWITIVTRHAAIDCRPRETKALPDDLEAPRLDDTYVHPRLKSALDALPEMHRNAVLLMYVYGMSHSELAEHMQAPLGTVKSWVRRGAAALKESLTG
jgi:RNA polymerase sigma-70 factor (ECF subfamily)